MATTLKTAAYDPMKETVEVYVPKVSGEDSTLYVAINGRSWLIPRGKKTAVPKPVADVIAQAEENAQIADAYISEQQKLMNIVQGAPV